jgi:two-component system, response regulator PdtaR
MLLDNSAPTSKLWLVAGLPDDDGEPARLDKGPAATSSLRVLIVEDEFYIALDVEASLTALGHSAVGIAVSGDEAVRLAERERPDVILMDIRLLGPRDGIDAAAEILSRFGIRSLFLTANSDLGTRGRAAAVNPIGFLEKPLTRQRLETALRDARRGQ